MALKPTILKATLHVADIDRGYYDDHKLTIAQHPSETDERTVVRLLAFALNAADGLTFTEGIAAKDEPDMWSRSLSGEIEKWIEVGLPDERRIRKACNRAQRVYVYAYGGRSVPLWWRPMAEKLAGHQNLTVVDIPLTATRSLEKLVGKTMTLQCTIQDGQIWMGDAANNVCVEPEVLCGAR
ncbi:MAG: YaeQ family protein [Nitrospinae bacterium]|nr:YaeQ family protein [Nitrospinota bacterium]